MATALRDYWAKTRGKFNALFKKRTEGDKLKKKNCKVQESIPLQTLFQTLNVEKNTDQDETILQNTYGLEQGSSRFTKNKEKKKQRDKESPSCQLVFDDKLALGVHVHGMHHLKTDMFISHPVVKIHVVDKITGQYVKKEDCEDNECENVDHILPIMTKPFHCLENKSVIPEWQEEIIFNERFSYLVENKEENPRVILLFEILDLKEAKANAEVGQHEQRFRKVAWGFLKLVGSNGVMNTDSKLRLQLFCPPIWAKRQSKSIEVFEWWIKYPRRKYPSTLYVTIKGIKLPRHVDTSMHSKMALQEERGIELQNEVTAQPLDNKPPIPRWSRLPGQECRIPNKPMLTFRGGKMGCFKVLFSNAGTMLAAACADRDAFPVVVYEIPSGKVLAAFKGHLKIVYDLCWSKDDTRLLSASSDGTVREWDIERLSPNAQKVLFHPLFVYSAQYHPTAQNLVVTGGYNRVVQVWRLDVDDVNGQLLHEFEGHSSFINSICFDSKGRRMFSADNAGSVIVWESQVKDSSHRQPCRHWCIEWKIDKAELQGVPINMLQLHPNRRCLLIHAKDNVLRMMDLKSFAVKKYTGAINYKDRAYSTFTPCGNFIFSGSADGMAYVWNTDTGDREAVYSELHYHTALHAVAFHPHENMVAFCAFGQSQHIHVYIYDEVSQFEVHNIKGMSKATSVDPRTVRNTSDSPSLLQDTSVSSSAMDQFDLSTRLMQMVKEKFNSVLEPHQSSSMSELRCE